MTFRELLEKYRAGQASEEERTLVEAELEKSEAIADYLAEQVEDELGTAEAQAPGGEVGHIRRGVSRRPRRRAAWAARGGTRSGHWDTSSSTSPGRHSRPQ